MSFQAQVEKAVHTISPTVVCPLATSIRPDLALLARVSKSDVIYYDPPTELSADELIHMGKLTDTPFVISAPQRESVRKSMMDAGLYVGRVPGDSSIYLASSAPWSNESGLQKIIGSVKVQTIKCTKLDFGLSTKGKKVQKSIHLEGDKEVEKSVHGINTIIMPSGDRQLVTGVALEAGVTDAQGEVISEEEIFNTMEGYMLFYRNKGLQHATDIGFDVDLVESWQTRAEIMHGGELVAKGSWMITWKIWSTRIWNALKNGNLDGFSVGGFRLVEEE